MSYDVALTTSACAHCGRGDGRVFDANMTSNVSGIWYRALMAARGKTVPKDWGSFGGAPHPLAATIDPNGSQWDDSLGAFGPLAGMTGGDAIPLLEAAANHITNNIFAYKRFEPSNGWGSALGAASFLLSIASAWKESPAATLSVWR